MKKSLLLAGLCLLGLSHVPAQAAPVFESAPFGGKAQPVPAGAKLTLQPRRASYFLGENVIADFQVENVAQTPFAISVGGDYRGGTRADRFKISALDAAGQPVADPSPTENNFGGLGGAVLVKPGQIWTRTLSLLPYLRLEAPGEYQLSATHDLGWKATKERSLPIAHATIQLQMPTPEQAREIVAKIEALPKADGVSMGERNPNEWADFSALHYPVYLPIIAPQIRAGDARFLPSVAKLETPEATRLLIELLDAKPEIARQAAAYLTERLPVNDADPMIPAALADRPELRAFRAQRLERVERSWRPEFAAPTLDYARRALQSDERETLRLGAHLMMNLGAAPDYSRVIAALNRRLPLTAKKPRWQYVGNDQDNTMEGWQLQDDCLGLARAALQIRRRDAATPPGDNTAADAVVEIVGMKTDPARLENAWAARVTPYLRAKLPFIRQLALESLVPPYNFKSRPVAVTPTRLTPDVRALLPALLADSDISVRVAAVTLAGASRDKSLASDVLKNLAQTRNSWDIGPANEATRNLGVSLRAAQIWANRLEQPKMFRLAIDSLLQMTTGRGLSGSSLDSPEQGALYLPRWRQFLHRNSAVLAANQTIAREKIPRDLYPADWSL